MPSNQFISRYGASSVTTTATLILDAEPWRKGALLCNNSTVTIYLGLDSNVTTTTGFPLTASGTFATNDVAGVWRGKIYGIAASGSADVRYWEFGA